MSDLELGAPVEPPQLRVEVLTPVVELTVGEPVTFVVQILNTTSVIETVSLELLSLMAETVKQHPEEITLFPEESLQAELEVTFHPTLPAGTQEGLLVVTGGSGALAPTEIPVEVAVPASPALSLQVEPPVRTGGRSERFEILVANAGNTRLDARLSAVDAERVCELHINRPQIALRVDTHTDADLLVRARRKWTGAPTDHAITVTAEAGELIETSQVLYRQKAVLTPGVITLLTLAVIVGVWAFIMLFGIRTAFTPSDPQKTVPASFSEGISNDHLDVAVVGGTIVGTVVAESTAGGVERITVEAFDSDGELVTATATDEDGAYELDGLLPGRYRVRLRGTGFEERWLPDAPDASGAEEQQVFASKPTETASTPVPGLPAAMGGEVVAGDGDPVATLVQLDPLDLVSGDAQPPPPVVTDEDGVWRVDGLVAPATYRISYTADGYDLVEVTQAIGAGEQLTVNPVRLPAAPGAVAGRVVSLDGDQLGGVQVLAQRGDAEFTTTTPTSGEIGAFEFVDLPTPGTYVLTFTADGFAAHSEAVRLEAGEEVRDLPIVLTAATGSVEGLVVDGAGAALGGVTVTVSGGDEVLTTDTLTSGAVGTFRVPGLPLPGTYTVNFDVDGYRRETVQVTLGVTEPAGRADVTLQASVGRLNGLVVDRGTGAPILGAAVAVSDGETVRDTTTASAPANQKGRFSIGNLPAGTYTVTVTTADGRTLTQLHEVKAPGPTSITLRVR